MIDELQKFLGPESGHGCLKMYTYAQAENVSYWRFEHSPKICRIRFLPLYLQKYSNYTIIIPLKHFNNMVPPFTKITWKKSIPKRAYKPLKIWCIWVHFFQVGVYLIHSIFNYNIYPLHIPLLRIIPNRDFSWKDGHKLDVPFPQKIDFYCLLCMFQRNNF